ncbi:hypothetical protein CRE_11178 [Caenorhabditis remanei]|uniref:Uncharacterized protein n=1 Tax=Caenorhabditis remanei TaxID=31234 RepID=E3MQ76_CAERE|nr:hypothetical protein CRE_11178 [Caenorhabditis remanei]
MTILTAMQMKYSPDPQSPYQLLLEASRSEDPSFYLENLKNSIRSSPQQDGGEVTVDQVREYVDIKQWVWMEKQEVEAKRNYYSDEHFSFKTKLAILYACFIFGAICCHLVYNLYLGQEIPIIIRGAFIVIMVCIPIVIIKRLTVPGINFFWLLINPLFYRYYLMKVPELKQRKLELIDCYQYQVLPMRAQIPANRYRHDVLTMVSVGEWLFLAFFRFCYSICRLSYNWSNTEIRAVESFDAGISGIEALCLSVWLIYFWHSSKLARRPAEHTKVGV